jgi:DNA-binding response OmpR family regulator
MAWKGFEFKNTYDLCILDVMMPYKTTHFSKGNREKIIEVPIIFLTAKVKRMFKGLLYGADVILDDSSVDENSRYSKMHPIQNGQVTRI